MIDYFPYQIKSVINFIFPTALGLDFAFMQQGVI